MTAEARATEWASGRRRTRKRGARARSARARSPELIDRKIGASSRPFSTLRPLWSPPAVGGFSFLAQRLGNFDQAGTLRTEEWAPDRYRATLLDGFAGEHPPTSWPWTDLKPTDFTATLDPNAMPMPTHTLTATQAAALGISPFHGGFQNVALVAPDKSKLYSLALRPLLPDESN